MQHLCTYAIMHNMCYIHNIMYLLVISCMNNVPMAYKYEFHHIIHLCYSIIHNWDGNAPWAEGALQFSLETSLTYNFSLPQIQTTLNSYKLSVTEFERPQEESTKHAVWDSCAGCTNALLFIRNCHVPHAVAIRRQYLHKHFALAKPHSLLSAVVTVSTITTVSEAARRYLTMILRRETA